jgi:hypothetical protein
MSNGEVIFDNVPVEKEFRRWLAVFGTEDPYHSDETVGMVDVLRAHFLALLRFVWARVLTLLIHAEACAAAGTLNGETGR